jgi:hypothetical protein
MPILGVSVHIPIGKKTIDFRINDSLIEFHPIVISRELKSSDARDSYQRLHRRLSGHDRDTLSGLLCRELAAQYHARRLVLIKSNATYRECELISCFSSAEVYNEVLRRFCPKDRLPSFQSFRSEMRK